MTVFVTLSNRLLVVNANTVYILRVRLLHVNQHKITRRKTMQDLPHHYQVNALAEVEGPICLKTEGTDDLLSDAPKEFGGPGDKWSPETLLVAAVADCFILSFRAVAHASKLDWISLSCQVDGTLERSDGQTKFTAFIVQPTLTIPEETSAERARKILEKAEKSCLITNSLSAETQLNISINRRV